MGAQERSQKSHIGLRGARNFAPLDPVEIVGKVENQLAKTVRRALLQSHARFARARPVSPRAALEAIRKVDGAELVGVNLRRIFARAEHMHEGEPPLLEGDRGAELQIADQRNLLDMAARFPGVAVEKEIAGDRPAVDAREQIPTERLRRFEEIRSRKARPMRGGP